MSEAKKQVLIVSLYDRGFYLSNELAEQGHNVTLLRLPYKMEDPSFWSNPFGFFKQDNLTYNQKYYLEGPAATQCESGLSLWLEDGPVDFKNHFSKDILQARGATGDWFEPFAKSLFSVTNNLDKFTANKSKEQDFSVDYSVKNSSEVSVQYELKNSERLGVKNKVGNINKIVKSDNKLSVEIGDEAFTFDKVICLLSSYEASHLNKELFNFIYNGHRLCPEWVWLSASFSYEPADAMKQIPSHFVVLEDVDSIWAYKNLLLVKKDSEKNFLNINFRWPYNERANLKYINNELSEIKDFFQSKINNLNLEVMPSVSEELSPFYVYNEGELNKFKDKTVAGESTIPFGPEKWVSWDLSNIMKQQYDLTLGES